MESSLSEVIETVKTGIQENHSACTTTKRAEALYKVMSCLSSLEGRKLLQKEGKLRKVTALKCKEIVSKHSIEFPRLAELCHDILLYVRYIDSKKREKPQGA